MFVTPILVHRGLQPSYSVNEGNVTSWPKMISLKRFSVGEGNLDIVKITVCGGFKKNDGKRD